MKKVLCMLLLAMLMFSTMLIAVQAAELQLVEVVVGVDNAVIVVEQGQTVYFTIKLWATGLLRNEITTGNPSKARVHTAYSVDDSAALSSSWSEWYNFWSKGIAADKDDARWSGYPTPYAILATAYAAPDATPGDYTIRIYAETSNPTITPSPPPGHTLRDVTFDYLTIRVVEAAPADNTPPITTKELTGTLGQGGWWVSDVGVTLTATDPSPGSGVKEIHYTLDGVETVVPGDTATFTITTEGTNNLVYWAVDNAGNEETHVTQEIKIDKTPPTLEKILSGTAGNDPWWVSDVTVTLNAEDEVSGVASIEYSFDGESWITYSEPFTISDEGTTTLYHRATDNAGNVYVLTAQTIKIDKTPPEVTITTPATEAKYLLNQEVLASWTATDAVSGIASATGTVPSGQPIDTSSVGPKTFTVTATDNAGNTATQTVTYYVRYVFGGILQPINPDGSSIFKLGSTVPVKFQLRDANGNFVTNAVARIFVLKISNGVTGSELEAVSTAAATTGNLFRYDPTNNQYIFNLNTKPLSTGTWRIRIVLDDGTSQPVNISLR